MKQQPVSKTPRRRVTDTDLAMKVQEVSHRQDLTESDVKQKLDTISNAMQAMQADQRETVRELKNVTSLAARVERQGDAINDLKSGQVEQMNRMETWLSEFEARQNAQFNRYENEQQQWRAQHEAHNSVVAEQLETKRVALEGEVRTLRENHRYASGWIKGLTVFGALLLGSVVYIFNDRFQGVQNGFADVRQTGQTNRRLIDEQMSKTHEIELYLARGGERRNGPYIPPQPEKTDAR